jgi:hypothetical protein
MSFKFGDVDKHSICQSVCSISCFVLFCFVLFLSVYICFYLYINFFFFVCCYVVDWS